jgi:hypothetical protein
MLPGQEGGESAFKSRWAAATPGSLNLSVWQRHRLAHVIAGMPVLDQKEPLGAMPEAQGDRHGRQAKASAWKKSVKFVNKPSQLGQRSDHQL